MQFSELAEARSASGVGVAVAVGVCGPEAAIERVCDGRSQVGILSREAGCKEVAYRPFFEDRVVLGVPSSHPWADRKSVTPQELIGQPFILREEMAGTRRVVQAGLLEHDIRLSDLDVVMELGSAEAIATAIEAGIGIAFLSRVMVQSCVRADYLVEVPVEGLFKAPASHDSQQPACPDPDADFFWGL